MPCVATDITVLYCPKEKANCLSINTRNPTNLHPWGRSSYIQWNSSLVDTPKGPTILSSIARCSYVPRRLLMCRN